jgi:hypothetical protein
MKENLSTFLLEAAERLRDLALRAPDIAHELRSFAEDLEQEAVQARREDGSRADAA